MRVVNVFRPPLVAIDVGTAVTRVSDASGDVLEHPSVVRERRAMRGGVVADVAGVASVVHALLARLPRRVWPRRPAAVICAPSDVSAEEREALLEAVAGGGASVVAVVPEPLAAAVGAGLDISSPYASAIVDIGDGVTDFAVFRNGTIVRSCARRIDCGTLHDEPVIEAIAAFLAAAVRELPDAMAAEVIESGIHVTGGGAQLDRLVRKIEAGIGFPLTRVHDPLHAVIRGAREMLRNRRLLEGEGLGESAQRIRR